MKRYTSTDVFKFICAYHREHTVMPSIREIMDGMGIKSSSTISHHLTCLARDGSITRSYGKARHIVINMEAKETAL